MSDSILFARVIDVSGLNGEVVIFVYSETSDLLDYSFFTLEDGTKLFIDHKKTKIKDDHRAKVKFLSIDTREKAESLCKANLFLDRKVLPKLGTGEYYYSDIVGAAVSSPGNGLIGKIVCIHNFGAGDIINIKVSHKQCEGEYMIPFRNEYIEKDNLPQELIISDEAVRLYCLDMQQNKK